MCGLAGIISTEKTQFNVNHFNVLGALNDERGGDSCGIFIDGEVKYGIKEENLFRNFTCDIKYPKLASIALLHCRKASPGYPVTLSQAQPVTISCDGKLEFVLLHNGTINNIQALAIKYIPEINTLGQSDSQILAQIIYQKGYDVLEEYTGCAVLVMVDYREGTPRVLLFKGSSCYNEPKSESERPLYYMWHDDKLYFSSIFCSLNCISNNTIIYNFPTNKLCEVHGDKLVCVRKINRKKLVKVQPALYSYGSSYYNSVNDSIYYDDRSGLYKINGSNAHGIYNVYPSGWLANSNYKNAVAGNTIPFFNGRLLINSNCYEFLNSIDDLFDNSVLYTICPQVVDYFSYGPRIVGNKLFKVDEHFRYVECREGEFITLFMNGNLNKVSDGKVTSKYIYPSEAIAKYNMASKGVIFDFKELEDQVLKFISKKLVDQDAVI
jgi:hypothetical protein